MDKLYKYLPFGIKIQDDGYKYRLEHISEDGTVMLELDTYGSGEHDGYVEGFWRPVTNVKPILRPFQHLTKEIPLTKKAAEMIGMKEGETVNSFYEFCKILIDFDLNSEESKFKLETDSFHQKAANIYVNSYYTWLRIELFNPYSIGHTIVELKQKPEIVCGEPNPVRRRIKVEQSFDFLRSMHFNLDFKEDEYIKLED